MARELTIEEGIAVTLEGRIKALKHDLAALENRAAELKKTDVRTPAEKAADEAVRRLWSAWYNYFLPTGQKGLSMADQGAFCEIAQPVLRKLAVGEVNVRMKGALVAAREKLALYRSETDGAYVDGMEYTALMRLIDEALAS